jgi:RNA recognition motif-containing protein
MNSKLYIENLPDSATESEIQKLFLQAGTVNSVWMSKDRRSGRSMGFAYLEMSNQAESQKAVEMFNGYLLGGHHLLVKYVSRPDEQGPPALGSNSTHSRPKRSKDGDNT